MIRCLMGRLPYNYSQGGSEIDLTECHVLLATGIVLRTMLPKPDLALWGFVLIHC